jgi:hypothetical protein
VSYRLKKVLLNRLTIPWRPFYRRYPYAGRVSINSADARGLVDMELGIFCNRIPKAANSTVVTNLARLRFGQDIRSVPAKRMFQTPASLTAAEVARFDTLFKFVIVRNPFTRTLSAYLEKIERRAERKGKQTTFRQFLEEVRDGALYRNAHWAPQSDLLLIPLEQFDFIGKVESLEQDLAAIKHRIRPDEVLPVTSARSHATGASEKLARYYEPDLIDMVRQIYQRDFELFGYSTDLPG